MKKIYTFLLTILTVLFANTIYAQEYKTVKQWDFSGLENKEVVTYSDETITINKIDCNIGTGEYDGLAWQGADKWFGYSVNGKIGLYNGNGGGRTMGILNLKPGYKVDVVATTAGNLTLTTTDIVDITNSKESGTETTYTYYIKTEGTMGLSLARYNNIYSIIISEPISTDELAIAKSKYESANVSYLDAITSATIDETFVDDIKLFWHPSSAVNDFYAIKASVEKSYSNTLVSEEETEASVYDNATATILNLIETINTAKTQYNSNTNMPQEGKKYMLKQIYSGKYFSFTTDGASLETLPTAVTFTAANEGRVYILSNDNLKLQVSHSSKDNWTLFGAENVGGSNSSEWLFIPQNDSEYRIQTPTQWRYIGGTSDTPTGNKKDTEGGISWVIEEYPSTISVTIDNGFGVATFTPSVALDFSNAKNIAAYKASVSGTTVNLTKVETVAAGEGVLVRSINGDAINEDIPVAADVVSTSEDNMFVGTLTDINNLPTDGDGYTNYILNNGSNGLGFYRANNQTVAAGKAYLAVPAASAAKISFFSIDGETVGIEGIESNEEAEEDVYYTISGQRVTAPTKGLYIKNGKKVIVK